MTREEIIRMAREAGFTDSSFFRWSAHTFDLERFAAKVAAAEREKVAQWMIQRSYATGHGDTIEDLLGELEWQIRESERRECAIACEGVEQATESQSWVVTNCVETILDRGRK